MTPSLEDQLRDWHLDLLADLNLELKPREGADGMTKFVYETLCWLLAEPSAKHLERFINGAPPPTWDEVVRYQTSRQRLP